MPIIMCISDRSYIKLICNKCILRNNESDDDKLNKNTKERFMSSKSWYFFVYYI